MRASLSQTFIQLGVAQLFLFQWAVSQPDRCILCDAPFRLGDGLLDGLLDETRFGGGITCTALLQSSEDQESGTRMCEVLQLTAFQAGCCSGPPPNLCSLCPDDSVPALPEQKVFSPADTSKEITCQDLMENVEVQGDFLRDFVGAPGICDNTRLRRSAGHCGCPSTNVDCNLCNGENVLSNKVFPLNGKSCSEISYDVALLSADQCAASDDILGFSASAFCCPGVAPPNQCQICGPNQQLMGNKFLTGKRLGDSECGIIQGAADFITSDESCFALQQEVSSQCCVDFFARSSICEIVCPNGNPPPDPFKTDKVTGYSCQSIAESLAPLQSDAECWNAKSRLGFDAEAFCCPDLDPPNHCPICPSGETLLHPERVLLNFNDHSCQELEDSLKHRTKDNDSCLNVLDESRALHNCQCRSENLPVGPPDANAARDGASDASRRKQFVSIWSLGLWTSLALFISYQ